MLGSKGLWIGVLAAVALLAASAAFAAAPAAKAKAKRAAHAAAGNPNEVAVLETSKGRMVVEFWPAEAPKTVASFKKLARSGFYNGTGFHRIMKGFMIQGGDPKSKNPKAPDLGTGNPGYTIPDEFNDHKHIKGVLSMAHSGAPNSGGSQFFIVDGNASFLDHQYTAFGHLIEGMDVLDKIASVPVGPNPGMQGPNGPEMSKPLEWVTLKSVKITSRAAAMAGGAKAVAGEKAAAAGAKAGEKAEAAKAEGKAKASEAAGAAGAKASDAASAAKTAAENAAPAAKEAAGGAPADTTHK